MRFDGQFEYIGPNDGYKLIIGDYGSWTRIGIFMPAFYMTMIYFENTHYIMSWFQFLA